MTDASRIPVLVAGAHAIERDDPVTALELAERAAATALGEAPRLAARIDRVSVVGILSRTGAAPATTLARRLRLSPSRCETTTIGGNTPQWLVTRAAADIAAGRIGAALVAGAEAMRSARQRRAQRPAEARPSGPGEHPRAEASAPEPDPGASLAPDPVVGDPRPGTSPAEAAIGLVLPAHVYPLFESVLAHRAGRSFAEQRQVLGRLLAPFTEVAAKHPFAWFREPRSAEEIAQPSPGNRLVAEPYTKLMNSFIGGDQAAALVVTSLAVAREAGVADRAVFVWSGADATEVFAVPARPDLGSCPALAVAAAAALGAHGLGADDLGAIDVYSCFPCAVELAADAIGLPSDGSRALTVTGGLPYFGGPGNNYVTHAIVTLADRLREEGGLGLVSGVGWYMTKHSVGVYGATPPPSGFVEADTAAEQGRIDASALPVVDPGGEPLAGELATVEASTVVYDGSGVVTAAPVVATLRDGRRVVAAADARELPALAGVSLVGAPVEVVGAPPSYRVAAV
jgi:acetyl-CoA C-acetyltransferase